MVQLAINMEAKSVARTLKEKGLATSYCTLLFMSKKLRIISTLLVICKMSERTRFLHFLTLEAAPELTLYATRRSDRLNFVMDRRDTFTSAIYIFYAWKTTY